MKEKKRLSLKAARVNAELTQMQVGQALGVSSHAVLNWESGRSRPSADKAQALASLYGLDMDDIDFCRKCSI